MTAATFASKSVISRKFSWPDESSKQQNFSLHSSIIYYISKNPSNPTAYLKLAQSCKYFFEKLPLLIAKEVYGNSRFCPNTVNECFKNNGKHSVGIDLTKLTSKIWLTNEIRIANISVIPNYISLLSSKLYRSDVVTFFILNQSVIFNDFIFMASSAKKISLYDVKMVYKDGKNVTLDAILEAVPNIAVFRCNFPIIGVTTFTNIAKLHFLSNLYDLRLYHTPENDKVDDIMKVIQKLKHAKFHLHFIDNISDEFKSQLNALIDTVIKHGTINCLVQYNGQDVEKLKIMEKRFY